MDCFGLRGIEDLLLCSEVAHLPEGDGIKAKETLPLPVQSDNDNKEPGRQAGRQEEIGGILSQWEHDLIHPHKPNPLWLILVPS